MNEINEESKSKIVNIAQWIKSKKLKQSVKKYIHLLERNKEKQKKLQKIENFTFFLLLTLILIIYAGLEFLTYQLNQEVYQQFLSNLNQDIIVDFYIEWDSQTCLKQDYSPLFKYNYSRVIKGCDCSQSRNTTEERETKKEIIIGKECTQQNLKNGCFTFNQELQQDLIYLNNNGSGAKFLICVKREKDISLKYNHTYCQQKQKTICYGQNMIYCLPKNINCPVSDFGIKTLEEIDALRTIFNISQIQLGDNKYFYFGYNINKMPISQVYLIKGENMCKLNKQQAFYEQQVYTENQQEACDEIDNLFFKIYAISEEQLYLSNNLIQYKNELSYFYIDRIHNWTLQAKPYILISDICQENEFYEKMLTNEYLNQIQAKRINQIILILIIFIFRLLIILTKYCLYKEFVEKSYLNNQNSFFFLNCIKNKSQKQKQGYRINIESQKQNQEEKQDYYINNESQKLNQKKKQGYYRYDTFKIISLIILVCYLILIIKIKLDINSIFEEIQQILSIPCIVRDDANNYLKYPIEDNQVQSFQNFLYYSFIILSIITIISYLLSLIGFRKDPKYTQNSLNKSIQQ